MRLSGVVLAACLVGAVAHAADDPAISDEFLDFLAEWDEESEEWLDTVGLEKQKVECNEQDDGGKCNDDK